MRQFCVEMLGFRNNLWVNRAHLLDIDGAIIAHIPDDVDIQYIMSNAKTLKGTGFVVHRDFVNKVREKRSYLMAVQAEIERLCGRRRMPLVFDCLFWNTIAFLGKTRHWS